ncbi:hypothetical protein [Algoriphagus sp. NG3]|uniref:hypothetical protein n=1 Tax=Algoriphagus sp. NG3 TaxID=3097546 RepID=UPI002A80BD5D|nr:hypothetical protein [Algoriphagus sp. NG3]WPR75603.1 hypothetical protein SLW71_23390 [Algoriphagus sp. NG3]
MMISTMFFVTSNGVYVPAATIVTGTAKPENRGGLSFNSAVQQLATGVASLFAGIIIGENAAGELTNYNVVGYIAIVFSLARIPLVMRVKVVS